MKRITSLLLLIVSLVALVGCTGGNNNNNNNNNNGGGNGGGAETPNTSELTQDLILDEDGNPVFEEEVRLSVWSVIGDPDQVVFREMVKKFNDEYLGQIYLDVKYVGHFDYYNALDSTYQTDFDEGFPDVCFMHNEKNIEYAYKGYFYSLDEFFASTGVSFDFDQCYDNIERATIYNGKRYGIPVDAHGFVTQFRQDIIKKNGLGFDGNTRFIPESKAEYEQLLVALREKADAGELLIRNINKGADHSWVKANPDTFYPSFTQSTDPDGLSALYANGGTLADSTQTNVTFHQNAGFQTYLKDQVSRFNSRLVGESGSNTEMFGAGNTVMFAEGPWWVSQTYTLNWNNYELKQAGEKGVSAEDAADPIMNSPYVASHPKGWWTTEENANSENANKWFGNGHVVTVTKHITSLTKAAAALTFAKWYTQSTDDKGDYNLVTWCASGHIPAWQNVYESPKYKDTVSKNITLQALGNPADIITLEALEYASTLITGLANACSNVIAEYTKVGGLQPDGVQAVLDRTASDTQATLDLLKMGF